MQLGVSSKEKINHFTIAFYNLENLFDTQDDPNTFDDSFTENADRRWNKKRFKKKVRKLSHTIQQIGYQKTQHPPVLLGVAEVENSYVMEAMVSSEYLEDKDYDFVHIDSEDERGIDTALFYRKEYFKVLDKKAHTVYLTDELGERDFTRDILHVTGELDGELVHVLVNHWPSRRAGAELTSGRRMIASEANKSVTNDILSEDPDARIIIMGDFNDDPQSASIQHLVGNEFYNPMELLLTNDVGSLNYRGDWFLFDQLIITNNFLQQHGNSFRFKEAEVFNPQGITEFKGKNKGNPFRTYAGKKYLGGISDHFPVYGIFSVRKG